ncbi:hypothetical protein DL96DRAFT_1278457 [Flagelloscypha sp. PMI_526]|nr:hypothetical protein DL96DRAFT_1278457 [Flagelloscypha sp. PMI_526]
MNSLRKFYFLLLLETWMVESLRAIYLCLVTGTALSLPSSIAISPGEALISSDIHKDIEVQESAVSSGETLHSTRPQSPTLYSIFSRRTRPEYTYHIFSSMIT